MEIIKSFKGFDKDLKCREFQYEIGGEYEEKEASCCNNGFHACENPLDVFTYYPPAEARYCEVEQSGKIDKSNGDSKVASTKITIGTEIGLGGIIKAGVKFIFKRVKFEEAATNTGDCSAATNTGDCSAATNTGYYSAATNTGDYSAATNTGDYSAATNTGKRSAATNTGDCSAATVGKGGSVAIVTGYQSKAKASLGSAIVVCERGEWNGQEYPLIGIKAAIIDGKKLKADTYYKLVNGEFVEIEVG